MELKKHEEILDKRVPLNSTIYFKNEKEIVFSTSEEVDAVLTGFSAYRQFGLKILSPVHDYYLPKKKLSLKEIFQHSLYIAEKDKNIRNLLYLALFYLKYQKQLKNLKHPLLDHLKAVLQGQSVADYPSLQEIKEKAEIYDIRF